MIRNGLLSPILAALAALPALAGCVPPLPDGDTDSNTPDTDSADTEADSDSDTDWDIDADSDTDSDTDTDADSDSATTAFGSTMIAISPGTFQMGSDDDGVVQDAPAHSVTLTHACGMGQTEVTQAQWAMRTGAPDTAPSSHPRCPDCPVEEVSWNDVARYANALSDAEGRESCYNADGSDVAVSDLYSCTGYRLPTEAEWEYAARAGEAYTWSGSDTASDVAWTAENSVPTQQVAGLAPNAWGLYDMSGNVFEWTNDRYGSYAAFPATDPMGPSSGADRVYRGGAWNVSSSYATVAYRAKAGPEGASSSIGFRLARSIP